MKTFVAWRILTHEKGRSGLATAGIFIAILLIFLQLGFYTSVPNGGMLVYDAMRFDLLITAREYQFQGRSGQFPRRRLHQARALAEVEDAMPLYQNATRWLNAEDRLERKIFLMAFNPRDRVFAVPDIDRQVDLLRRPDTVLIDDSSRAMFGPQTAGRVVEIADRKVTIGGKYDLGVGFVGLGVVVLSDQNYIRIFPDQNLARVSLGLVTLKPVSDAAAVAKKLSQMLPDDSRVFTREQLSEHEVAHWVTRTSTGLVFGFGVIVAFIVGMVILFQTLSTQISRNLPEYATLKAMGYTNGFLGGIVIHQAVFMAAVAFVPAVGLAVVIYDVTREATLLPIIMTGGRIVFVLAVTLVMSTGSAMLALRAVRRADPVDLF